MKNLTLQTKATLLTAILLTSLFTLMFIEYGFKAFL